MASNLTREIAAKIGDCVAGVISSAELQDWLAPILWDIDEKNDPEAESLACSAELALSEYVHGHLTEGELKAQMRDLVPDYHLQPQPIKTQ